MSGFEIPSKKAVAEIEGGIDKIATEMQDIDLEKGDLDREIKQLESEAEKLAEKSAELTLKLQELIATRESDPTAAELADIEEDLNELGTLWNHIKTSTPFGLIATGIGTATTIGVVEASAGNWQGWGWLALAGAMIAKATPGFKQVIEDYRSKKAELESRKNQLQANLPE